MFHITKKFTNRPFSITTPTKQSGKNISYDYENENSNYDFY